MDASTLFVADEDTGTRTVTGATTGELDMMTLGADGKAWVKSFSFKDGLGGTSLSGASWNIKQDGLRNISGHKDTDCSFWIYGSTSTTSDQLTHDLGADSNQLLGHHIAAKGSLIKESLLQSAAYGSRFGGVADLGVLSIAAVSEPNACATLLTGLGDNGFCSAS